MRYYNVGDIIKLKSEEEMLRIDGVNIERGAVSFNETTLLWDVEYTDLKNAYSITVIENRSNPVLDIKILAAFTNGRQAIKCTTSSKLFKLVKEEEPITSTKNDVFDAGRELRDYLSNLKQEFVIKTSGNGITLSKDGVTVEIKL